MTWLLFALGTTLLTSFLPICNKLLLRTQTPALVAWKINTFSLPLLTIGTWLFTQCRFNFAHTGLNCTTQIPHVDLTFFIALLISAFLNWGATLLSTHALKQADASLVTPLLTFNPAFTAIIAWIALREQPGLRESIGIVMLLFGTYLLDVQNAATNLFEPLRTLVRRPGTLLALAASACWGATTVLEKLAIEHTTPPGGPLVALVSTIITVVLLTPDAWLAWKHSDKTAVAIDQPESHPSKAQLSPLLVAIVIAGIAPLFGFTAIAQGYVGYVTAIFKLSTVLTLLWARMLLSEGNLRSRLLGTCVMLLGAALIA
jgi:uncharacterized membrane protein